MSHRNKVCIALIRAGAGVHVTRCSRTRGRQISGTSAISPLGMMHCTALGGGSSARRNSPLCTALMGHDLLLDPREMHSCEA